MKILLHADVAPWLSERLAAAETPDLSIAVCPPADREGYTREAADAHVIWHALEPLTVAHFDEAPALRLVQKIGIGVNTIDLETARARGVAVCNMPGTNTAAVVEHTLLLMLAVLRDLVPLAVETAEGGRWADAASRIARFGELGGRRVGLVGYGAVPRALAPVLAALGAEVAVWARSPLPADVPYPQLDKSELLARSDVLSLHIPLVDETALWLDAEAVATLPEGAIVVNTARGGLVDEAALIRGLESGRIAGAGLDVFATEPPEPGSALVSHPHVVGTPHIAWLTRETWERSLDVALDNVRRIATGEALRHQVV